MTSNQIPQRYNDVTSILIHSRSCWDNTHIVADRPIRTPFFASRLLSDISRAGNYHLNSRLKIRREKFGCLVQNRDNFTIRAFSADVHELFKNLVVPKRGEELLRDLAEADQSFIASLLSDRFLVPVETNGHPDSRAEFFDFPDGDGLMVNTPIAIDLEITLKCNRRCSYCAYQSGPNVDRSNELPTAFWLKVLDQAREAGVFSIEFTGGDPLTREDWFTVLHRADELGLFYTINSDLTGTPEATLSQLKSLQNLIAVQTTIDGPSPEIHDRLRGRGSLKKTLIGVERLVEKGIPVHAGMIISKHNFNQVQAVAKLCRDVGIGSLFVGSLYAAGRARDRLSDLPTNEQLGKASRAYTKAVCEGLVQPVHPSFYHLIPLYKDDPKSFNHLHNNPNMVDAGIYNFRIDPAGKVFTSIKLEDTPVFFVGDASKDDIMSIWKQSPELAVLREIYKNSKERNHYHALDTTAVGGPSMTLSLISADEIRNAQKFRDSESLMHAPGAA